MSTWKLQSGIPMTASLLVCLAALTGCNVGPKYIPPAKTAPPAFKETPAEFKEGEDWMVAQPKDAEDRGKWWKVYNDPDLDALEGQLNIDNQNIKQSFENFMEARAIVREARSQYFPTVTIGAAPTYSQTSSNVTSASNAGTGSSAPTSGTTTTATSTTGRQSQLYSIDVNASWVPDLWDRVRNTVRAAQYSAQMSASDLENEKLTEQASLAEYFFEIRGQDELQRILDDTVAADKKAVDSERARYETGVDDQIALVQAQTTLESAESDAINLGIARAQYEHAIATLIGKPASSFSIPMRPSTRVPPPIPPGLPSQLLERRPDIAAAERTMAAANAQIGVEDAAFYPTLTLSASGGFESSSLKKLFNWSSRFWSAGPSISETVYDGGLRRATVNQYIATYNADLAFYRQTVLTAFQQVEDSLASVRILSQQIEREKQAVDSSKTYLDLETGRYETGIDPYTEVVTAETTLLSNQETLAISQVQYMTASVQLIQALGGGWDRSELPSTNDITKKPTRTESTIQH
jgi:NodT family efflux transporter outer membrane factor (OMF) lipoprotein